MRKFIPLGQKGLVSFCLIFFFGLAGSPARETRAEFIGEPPTGLFLLEEKHPCYLFVPADYAPEKSWPLLLLLGGRGEDPKEVIEPWVEWAKKNGFLVLAASNLFNDRGEKPEAADRWFLQVKREMTERYRVNPSRVLLVGLGSGAHYAAYLGLNYPNEFSGAALIGTAWPGPLEPVMVPPVSETRRISFYLALDPQGEEFSKVESKSRQLEAVGCRITFEPLKAGQELSGVRESILRWFLQNSESEESEEPGRGLTKLVKEMRRNLFEE